MDRVNFVDIIEPTVTDSVSQSPCISKNGATHAILLEM